MTRLLISGGPGSGCTSTAAVIGTQLGLPVLDSDTFFHKPTDPPFQEQYTPEERRLLLGAVTRAESAWVLSGSIATWGLEGLSPTHAVYLNVPQPVRLERLLRRQREQFGTRIEAGGDMQEEHALFMEWAAGYEDRTDIGRNQKTDHGFLQALAVPFLDLSCEGTLEEAATCILEFLAATAKQAESPTPSSAACAGSPPPQR